MRYSNKCFLHKKGILCNKTNMQIDYINASQQITDAFGGTSDLIRLDFEIATISCGIYFIDGMIDKILFEDNMLKPLKALTQFNKPYLEELNKHTMMTTPIKPIDDVQEAIAMIAGGEIILVIQGADSFYMYSEKKYNTRAIQEPPVSNVLRGPREGFVEDVKANITMVRRRLATADLRLDMLSVGKYTATKVCIAYLNGVAEQNIVEQVKQKIEAINIDGVIESSYIARYLETNKLSLFSQVGTSEKPDILCAKMLEGRVAILVDGSPCALTVPFVLFESFQASEDYYIKSYRASLIRLVRLLAMFIAIILPAAYVALQQYQYQMLPLKFLLAIVNAVSVIPLSPTLEMFAVLIIFEILSETSIRMPKYIGMALSIVGAIVLGETAVSAGLVSSPTILVTALSTIGIFCVPDESNTASVLRLIFVAIGGVSGIFGIILGGVFLLAYLCTIQSFGVSFLSPYAPMITHDWQDGFFKGISARMKERPFTIPTKNRRRVNDDTKPENK